MKTREVLVGVDEPAIITLKEGDIVRFGDRTVIDGQRNHSCTSSCVDQGR